MDDPLLGVRVDPRGVELLELVADAYDQVGAVEPEIDVVAAHEADRADRIGVVVGNDALSEECRCDRDAQPVGEVDERFAGVVSRRTVAGPNERMTSLMHQLRSEFYLTRCWRLGT